MNETFPDLSGNPKSPERNSGKKQKLQGSIILMEIIRVSTADQKTNPDSEHTE